MDDFEARWNKARLNYWEDTSDRCDECVDGFELGHVIYAFDAPAPANVKRYFLCHKCAEKAYLVGNEPIATVIYLPSTYRGLRHFDLLESDKAAIINALEIVDQIHERVAALNELAKKKVN